MKNQTEKLGELGIAETEEQIAKWKSDNTAGDNENDRGTPPHNNSKENEEMAGISNGVQTAEETDTRSDMAKNAAPQPPVAEIHLKLPAKEVAKATLTAGAIVGAGVGVVWLGVKLFTSND